MKLRPNKSPIVNGLPLVSHPRLPHINPMSFHTDVVGITQAATLMGVDRKTIRRWIQRRWMAYREGTCVCLADVRRCIIRSSQAKRGRPCGTASRDYRFGFGVSGLIAHLIVGHERGSRILKDALFKIAAHIKACRPEQIQKLHNTLQEAAAFLLEPHEQEVDAGSYKQHLIIFHESMSGVPYKDWPPHLQKMLRRSVRNAKPEKPVQYLSGQSEGVRLWKKHGRPSRRDG